MYGKSTTRDRKNVTTGGWGGVPSLLLQAFAVKIKLTIHISFKNSRFKIIRHKIPIKTASKIVIRSVDPVYWSGNRTILKLLQSNQVKRTPQDSINELII